MHQVPTKLQPVQHQQPIAQCSLHCLRLRIVLARRYYLASYKIKAVCASQDAIAHPTLLDHALNATQASSSTTSLPARNADLIAPNASFCRHFVSITIDSDACQECKPGFEYDLDSRTCLSLTCGPNCATCKDSSYCAICQDFFFLDESGKCISCVQVPHCASCSSR